MSFNLHSSNFRIATLLVAALIAALGFSLVASSSSALAGGGGVGTGSGGSSGSGGKRSHNSGGSKYDRIWHKTAKHDKRWARKTSRCESGGDPKAIGGGGKYRGAFQFARSTWRSSPKSPGGDPIKYSYRTQAVVAVKLKHRDGAGHWPNCG